MRLIRRSSSTERARVRAAFPRRLPWGEYTLPCMLGSRPASLGLVAGRRLLTYIASQGVATGHEGGPRLAALQRRVVHNRRAYTPGSCPSQVMDNGPRQGRGHMHVFRSDAA
jgi:hypothetical protein